MRTKRDFACRRHHHQAAASLTLQNRDAAETFVLHHGSKRDAQRWCLERGGAGQNPCVSPEPRPRGTTSLQPSDMKSTCTRVFSLIPVVHTRGTFCFSQIWVEHAPFCRGRLTVEHRLSRAHYSLWRSETKTTCLRRISVVGVHELHGHGGILAVLHPGRAVKLCYRDISWRNPTPFLTQRLSLDTSCLGLVVKHPDSRPVFRGPKYQMGYIWKNQSQVGHSAVGDSSALDCR